MIADLSSDSPYSDCAKASCITSEEDQTSPSKSCNNGERRNDTNRMQVLGLLYRARPGDGEVRECSKSRLLTLDAPDTEQKQ